MDGLCYFDLDDICTVIINPLSKIQLKHTPNLYPLRIPKANNQQEITDFIRRSLQEKRIEITELKSIELSLAIDEDPASPAFIAFSQLIQASSPQVNVSHPPVADAFSVHSGMPSPCPGPFMDLMARTSARDSAPASHQNTKTIDLSNKDQIRDCPLAELQAQALQAGYGETEIQELMQQRKRLKNRKSALQCSQSKADRFQKQATEYTKLLTEHSILQESFAKLQEECTRLSKENEALLQARHNTQKREPNSTVRHESSRFFPYARPSTVGTDVHHQLPSPQG